MGAALSCAPVAALAEDGKITVSLGVRARVEAIDGQFRPGVSDTAALLIRTEIAAEYDAGPFRIGGEIVDARAYFTRQRSSLSTTEVNALEPIQAYVATDFSDLATAKAGRFTLSLGSRRLITRNNFRNTINSFTGVQAVIGKTPLQATLFWVLPTARLPSDSDGLRDNAIEIDRERGAPRLLGAFVSRPRAAFTSEAYLYRLAEHDAPGIATRDRRLWTAGSRILRAPAKNAIDFEIEGAWQWGETRETTAVTDTDDRPVSAGFAHAAIGRTLSPAWQPRIAIAIDAATGDGRARSYNRFDTLYGGRAFDFGPTSFYGALTRANLLSAEARLETKPDAKTETLIALRPLWLASATDSFATTGVRDSAGDAGRYAGTQIEGRVRRWLVPQRLRVAVGGAVLFKGRFLNDAANAPATGDTHFGYAELSLTL